VLAEINIQVARGLGAAQEKNIIHLDITPENIFISVDGHIKIFDFGLARVNTVESAPTPDATLTMQTKLVTRPASLEKTALGVRSNRLTTSRIDA
jgi:serine/threonine protein kinase